MKRSTTIGLLISIAVLLFFLGSQITGNAFYDRWFGTDEAEIGDAIGDEIMAEDYAIEIPQEILDEYPVLVDFQEGNQGPTNVATCKKTSLKSLLDDPKIIGPIRTTHFSGIGEEFAYLVYSLESRQTIPSLVLFPLGSDGILGTSDDPQKILISIGGYIYGSEESHFTLSRNRMLWLTDSSLPGNTIYPRGIYSCVYQDSEKSIISDEACPSKNLMYSPKSSSEIIYKISAGMENFAWQSHYFNLNLRKVSYCDYSNTNKYGCISPKSITLNIPSSEEILSLRVTAQGIYLLTLTSTLTEQQSKIYLYDFSKDKLSVIYDFTGSSHVQYLEVQEDGSGANFLFFTSFDNKTFQSIANLIVKPLNANPTQALRLNKINPNKIVVPGHGFIDYLIWGWDPIAQKSVLFYRILGQNSLKIDVPKELWKLRGTDRKRNFIYTGVEFSANSLVKDEVYMNCQ